jgi:hypothetical protein
VVVLTSLLITGFTGRKIAKTTLAKPSTTGKSKTHCTIKPTRKKHQIKKKKEIAGSVT